MAIEKLTRAVISGSTAALSLVKTFLTLPKLICEDPKFEIYLEVTSHNQHGEAQVSENPIVTTGGNLKMMMTDNVAPGTWTWTLSGYIPGNPLLELSNLYTPIVEENVAYLKDAYKNGKTLTFMDTDRKIYNNVVIQSIDIDTKEDCRNKAPFAMVLKEIFVMETGKASLSKAEILATPKEGSKDGEAKDLGTVQSKDFKYDSVFGKIAYKDKEFL